MLAEGRGGALPSKAADLAALAHSNAVRLARIVDDMLDLDRVKQGRMTFTVQRCKLHVLARQAVEAVQTFGDAFGVALPCGPWPEDAEVFADPDRVVQILVNLLSNATKYSPPGGPVTTRIVAAGTGWVVEVEDRGPGIPEAFQARIFESFAQAGGPQQQPGSGLGLSISKSFAEAMGGALDFESRPGRTVFRLRLPAAGGAPAAGTALPRILHVEDDAAVSQLLAAALEGVAALENASSLAQAERRLAEAAWALVVLDSHLPDGEGLSLLPRLRELGGPGLPVLLFTGEDTFPGMAGDIAYVFLKGSVGPGEIRRVIQGFLAER
jgi:CheY-like chemotaxis protein